MRKCAKFEFIFNVVLLFARNETVKPLLSTPLLRDLWISLSSENECTANRRNESGICSGAERRLFAHRNFKEKQTNKTIKDVT